MDYNRMANKSFVENQYSDDTALKIRKSLHRKYSSNKQGFGNWLFSQYKFKNGDKVLELGSGNGDIWEAHVDTLAKEAELTLSDFSGGMVDILTKKYAQSNIRIQKIDIQDIPYDDKCFDVIIANAMLYHVPDIDKAISEVHRVLKPGGTFYTSTFGENGLSRYINDCLGELGIKPNSSMNVNFTLQNGQNQLEKIFNTVERVDYEDSLNITNITDLVDYIFSMTSMTGGESKDKATLTRLFETKRNEKGIISIRKEYGMFISKRV